MRRLILALAAVASLASAVPAARAEEQVPKASVTTSGEATVYVKPDEVVVSFGVETVDPSLDKSKEQNDAASARLVKAVKEAGVEERHLQVDALTVQIRYRESGRPVNGIDGYLARRNYSATLKDVKLLDKLLDAILKNGANQLGGIEFRTTELRKHRDAARKMAIKAAKEKADALAEALDVHVGGPRTITEGASYGGYSGGQSWFGNGIAQNAMQAAPAAAGGDDEATMPLGQIAVRASVSVMFDLK
jgi:uncharacterized protein YggE